MWSLPPYSYFVLTSYTEYALIIYSRDLILRIYAHNRIGDQLSLLSIHTEPHGGVLPAKPPQSRGFMPTSSKCAEVLHREGADVSGRNNGKVEFAFPKQSTDN